MSDGMSKWIKDHPECSSITGSSEGDRDMYYEHAERLSREASRLLRRIGTLESDNAALQKKLKEASTVIMELRRFPRGGEFMELQQENKKMSAKLNNVRNFIARWESNPYVSGIIHELLDAIRETD